MRVVSGSTEQELGNVKTAKDETMICALSNMDHIVVNVSDKRAPQASERRTLPTLRTPTQEYLNNAIV